MFWTLLALLLMIVLGGFISYYGDLQGRRWGKRRVSWFGLRPKHTAIVITSLTGAFIALMSIITVLVASPTVREVVLKGERAIRENQHALEEIRQLNQSLAAERKTTRQEVEALKTSKELVSADLKLTKTQLVLAQQKVELAQQKLTPVQAEVTRLQTAQTKLAATLKQEQAAIRQKSAELQTKIADNKRASEANVSLSKQLQDNSRQLQESSRQQERLSRQNRVLEEGNKDLQQKKDILERLTSNQAEKLQNTTRQNDILLESNKRLVSDNNELETKIRAGSTELNNRQRELNRVNAELARANTQLDQAYSSLAGDRQTFTQSYHALRQGEINIRAGADMARRIIPGGLSRDAARRQLVQLLEDAGDTAGVYGASRGDNNRAVRIVSKKLVTPFETQDADEAASLNALSEVVAGSSTPVLVVATALNNSLRGEQAIVELRPFPVKRVFDKEEVVASRLIDATQTPQRVKEAIAEFLQQNVKTAATRAGSIPRVNPETGRKEIGVYDSIALGQLAERVKRMGGNVLLKAVATAPITSADPLDDTRLRFDTVRAPQG